MNDHPILFNLELAGSLSPELYEQSIPEECQFQTLEAHVNMLGLCWGLTSSIERGQKMDCKYCDERRKS